MEGKDMIHVSYQDAIATITLNRDPVNALSGALRTAIYDQIDQLSRDPDISAIIITTNHLPFSAGADIKEFSQGYLGKTFMDLYQVFQASEKPIIAGIRHYALGGGLELAMLCHHRVSLADAKLGQPEIKLGIIPGGTGTQSLPRLVGVENALHMIVSGKPITAEKALSWGLVDEICSEDLHNHCIQLAKKCMNDVGYKAIIPLHRGLPKMPNAQFFNKKKSDLEKHAYGFQAPEIALSCIQASCEQSVEAGLAFEQKQFMSLMTGPASQAMRYQFMAEHLARQVPGLKRDTPMYTCEKIGVVGGGLMGSGIAIVAATKADSVIIVEKDLQALARCQDGISKHYAQMVAKGKLTEHEAQKTQVKISLVTDLEALADRDLVVEAVFEDMKIKLSIFNQLDAICQPDCILASNTSGLDINTLAQATKRPGQVLGLHFFSPAPVMRLLEVVRGQFTSDKTLATALSWAKVIKKVSVCVGVCPGFVGNRMVIRYFKQVEQLLLEGCKPLEVDQALEGFGFAMGPCKMADMSGLDISMHMMPGDTLAKYMVEQGRLGKKSQSGFYDYEHASHIPHVSHQAQSIIQNYAKKKNVKMQVHDQHSIVERCVLALIEEGVHILDEGVVFRSSDIDVVYVYGYGFPAYRGGPMFYADNIGLSKVADLCDRYAKFYPDLWIKSQKLIDLASTKEKLSQQKSSNSSGE